MDELNEKIGYSDNDKHVGMVVRGASVAGMVTSALAFPSVWKTLKAHFPRGLTDSFRSRFVTKGINPYELTYAVSAATFEKYRTPEATIQTLKENLDKRQRLEGAALEAEKVSTEIRNSPYNKAFRDRLERTAIEEAAGEESMSKLRGKIAALEETVSEKTREDFRGRGTLHRMPGHLAAKQAEVRTTTGAKRAVLIEYARDHSTGYVSKTIPETYISTLVQDPTSLTDERITGLFDDIVQAEESSGNKEVARRYIAKLQGRNYGAVVADEYRTSFDPKRIARLDTVLKVKRNQTFRLPAGVEWGKELQPKTLQSMEWRMGLKSYPLIDDFVEKAAPEIDKFAFEKVHQNTSIELRGALRTLHDDVRAFNRQNAAKLSFSVSLEHSDPVRKTPQIMVRLMKEGRTDIGVFALPLPNESSVFKMPSSGELRIASLTRTGTKLAKPMERATTGGRFLKRVKQAFNYMIRDYEAGKKPSENNIYLKSLESLRDMSYNMEGGFFRNIMHSNTLVHSHIDDFFGKSEHRAKIRAMGMQDWRLYQLSKQSGLDVFYYDLEFAHKALGRDGTGHVGPQVLKKDIKNVHLWQMAFKVKRADGSIESENIFVKNKQLLNPKSQLRKSWEATLRSMGQGGQINYYLDKMEKGINIKDAMVRFAKASKGTLRVDQHGDLGVDRQLLNHLSKRHLNRPIMTNTNSVDFLNMYKLLSYTDYGHGLEELFAREVSSANGAEVDSILQRITGKGAVVSKTSRWRRILKEKIKSTSSLTDKKNWLVMGIKMAAHDAADDTAALMFAHELTVKHHPLMGTSETDVARTDRFLTTGYLDWKTKMRSVMKFSLARHYFGERGAVDALEAGVLGTQPQATSPNAMLGGKVGTLGTLDFDIFGMGNSQLKQEYQKFDGVPISMVGSDGRMKTMWNKTLEKYNERLFKTSISSNLQMFANMPMLNVLYIPHGYTAESAGYIDKSTAKHLYGFHAAETERINFADINGRGIKLQDLHPGKEMERIMRKARRLQEKYGLHKDDFQMAINKVLERENRAVARLHQKLQSASGSRADKLKTTLGKMFRVHNDDMVAKVVGGMPTEEGMIYSHHRPARVVSAALVKDEFNGLQRLELEYERLVSFDSGFVKLIRTGGGKDTFSTANINDMFTPVSEDEWMDKTRRRNKLDIAVGMNYLSRQEFGAYRRAQFFRVYKALLLSGGEKEARKFVKGALGAIEFDINKITGTIMFDAPMTKVKEINEVLNNVNAMYLDKWMSKTHRWDRTSIKAAAEAYNITLRHDASDMKAFKTFADKAVGKFENEFMSLRDAQNLDAAVDNRILEDSKKLIRAQFPYYDIKTGKYRYDTENLSRWMDYHRHSDTKHVIPALRSMESFMMVGSFENQNKPIVNKIMKIPDYIPNELSRTLYGWDKSPLREMMNRSKGAYKRSARKSLTNVLHMIMGDYNTQGKTVGIEEINAIVTKINDSNRYKNIDYSSKGVKQIFTESYLNSNKKIRDATIELEGLERIIKDNPKAVEEKARAKDLWKIISGDWRKFEKSENQLARKFVFADDNLNSLWKDLSSSPVGGLEGFISYGAKGKIAPSDLLLIKAPGVKALGSKDFFASIINRVMADERIPEHMKESWLKTAEMMTEKEGVLAMPSPQAVRDILKMNYFNYGGKSAMKANKAMMLYENTFHMLLKLNNETQNAVAANLKEETRALAGIRNDITNNYSELASILIKDKEVLGKKGLLATENYRFLEGQYGTSVSQQLVTDAAINNLNRISKNGKLTKVGMEELILKIKQRKPRLNEMQLRKLATGEYEKSKNVIKMMLTPGVTPVSKQAFLKTEMNGMSMVNHLKTLAKREGDEKISPAMRMIGKILKGEEGVAGFLARDPVDRYQLAPTEFRVIDTDLFIFSGSPAKYGIQVNPIAAKMIGNDFDADSVWLQYNQFQSMKDMDNGLKYVRGRQKKLLDFFKDYNNLRLTKKLSHQEIIKRLKPESSMHADAIQTVEIMEDLGKDYGLTISENESMTNIGMKNGYLFKNMAHHEKIAKGYVELSEFTAKAALDMVTPHDLKQFVTKLDKAGQTLALSKIVIGDMASKVTKMQLHSQRLRDMLDNKPGFSRSSIPTCAGPERSMAGSNEPRKRYDQRGSRFGD
jgi:hypothetical protein